MNHMHISISDYDTCLYIIDAFAAGFDRPPMGFHPCVFISQQQWEVQVDLVVQLLKDV